ncbi:hypothetical protein, partial [Bradyrhizobium uaiense]|uniref:hypothetical protein n=1 Tax=Bradyrhizobium uaiense TaxID=2594946 RepID=UPI0019D6779C
AQRLAVGVIDEAVRKIQLGVEREQQRQPRRPDRIDVLVFAAVPIAAAISPTRRSTDRPRASAMPAAMEAMAAMVVVTAAVM